MWTAELLRKARCGRWWGDPVALEQAGDVVFALLFGTCEAVSKAMLRKNRWSVTDEPVEFEK